MFIDTGLIWKVIPIGIALIDLILSIVVAWNNRKALQVEIYNNLDVVKGGSLLLLVDNENPLPYSDGLIGTIEVVNPSPRDIVFCDLRANYPQSNMNVDLLTKRTIFENHSSKTSWLALEASNCRYY